MNYRDQYLDYKKKYLELKKKMYGGLISPMKRPKVYILEDEYKKIIEIPDEKKKIECLKKKLKEIIDKYEKSIEKAQRRKQKVRDKNDKINKLLNENEILDKKLKKMKKIYIAREQLENFGMTKIE